MTVSAFCIVPSPSFLVNSKELSRFGGKNREGKLVTYGGGFIGHGGPGRRQWRICGFQNKVSVVGRPRENESGIGSLKIKREPWSYGDAWAAAKHKQQLRRVASSSGIKFIVMGGAHELQAIHLETKVQYRRGPVFVIFGNLRGYINIVILTGWGGRRDHGIGYQHIVCVCVIGEANGYLGIG